MTFVYNKGAQGGGLQKRNIYPASVLLPSTLQSTGGGGAFLPGPSDY